MFRRLLRAINAIVFGHVIVRLGALILVPLFLKYWSASLYGEYVALFAAAAYLASLDIGMQQAAINRLTQAYARKDLAEYRSVQQTALAFYLILGFSVTLLMAGAVWLLPIHRWMGLKQTQPATAALVMVLLAAYVMWCLPMRLITATAQTTGNLARSQWIANTQQVIAVLLSAWVLIHGGRMLTIAAIQIASVALTAMFALLDIRRRSPELFPGTIGAKLSVLKDLAHPSFLFALLLAGNLIAYQGSILLTSAFLGGLAVAVLSISKAVIDVVRQGLYSIGLAMCPDYARMEALGEFERLRRAHRIIVALTATVTLAFVASFWYVGPEVISVWTRGRLEPDAMLLRLFLVLLAFQTPWAASATIATSTNRHKVQAVGYFCAATLGICVVAVLLPRLGLWAVPVGLIIGEAVGCYHFVIKATCHIIGESYPAFALRFWLGFLIIGSATLATGWIVHALVPGPMLVRWIAMGLLTSAVAIGCAWGVWLTPEDRVSLSPKLAPLFSTSS